MEILILFLSLNIGKVGISILVLFLNSIIEILQNTPYDTVKFSCLDFLGVSFLFFPLALGGKLENIKDTIRMCIFDENKAVSNRAGYIYMVLFTCIPNHNFNDYFKCLEEDILACEKKIGNKETDPYISKIPIDDISRKWFH